MTQAARRDAADFHAAVAKVHLEYGARWRIEHDETVWPRRWTAAERAAPRRIIVTNGIVALALELRKASAVRHA